ncbi:MAG: hypothetical protein ACR2L2_15385 [Acidobacteriota bacterium]
MPKDSPIFVVDGKERVPFLRGMITHALLERGLKFDEAYDVASLVRQEIRESGEVLKSDLSKIILKIVRNKFGEDFSKEYALLEETHASVLVTAPGEAVPFSKGILSQSLQASGLDPGVSYEIARDLEIRLHRSGQMRVDRKDLRVLVHRRIQETSGKKFAERYLLWRKFKSPDKPIILLFGGATGTGKSSLATEVAHRLGISKLLSTDTVRQILRMMFSPELLPSIHHSSYEAWKDSTASYNQNEVIEGFREQSLKVCVGVKAMIERSVEENIGMVIDGVHLVPGFINYSAYEDRAYIVPLIISTLNKANYRERFSARQINASRRTAERYMAHFEQILEIQTYILEMAERHSIPIIENNNLEDTVASVLSVITNSLKEQLKRSEKQADKNRDLAG